MGAHWINPKAPEFNGRPFNEAFVYGFYRGKMVFVEPMVTIAFLKTKPEITKELKLLKISDDCILSDKLFCRL